MKDFKAGDVIVWRFPHEDWAKNKDGSVRKYLVNKDATRAVSVTDSGHLNLLIQDDVIMCLADDLDKVEPKEPHGGPSSYYDFPFKDWITLNDQIEFLAVSRWKDQSTSFKDIFKALCRWGEKSGTTKVYDAKKILYYGARVLRQLSDTKTLRAYLQELLDDPQFKE